MAEPASCSNHWTVGVGRPETSTVNRATLPDRALASRGWSTIRGATGVGVTVAVAEVAGPTRLVNTAR